MGTTIESGGHFATQTTSKMRFTKGPAEVTEDVASADQVVLGQVDSSDAPARFRDFDAGTRAEYKDTVKTLASQGRLFVREEQGLRRADPMEIKERLDQGQGLELVTRLASESRSSATSSSSSASKERGLFTGGWNVAESSSRSSSSQRVIYTTSPISEWESLEFASSGAGVQGVPLLPPSGNSVEVSSSFESQWSQRASEQWGFFTDKERQSSAGGFYREATRPDAE